MSAHRDDPIPRSYRRLQPQGERRVWLKYWPRITSRWLGGTNPTLADDDSMQTKVLMAEFLGTTAPVGPQMHIDDQWVYATVGVEQLDRIHQGLTADLAREARTARYVADQGEEIEWSFSVVVYATARLRVWRDEVPGLTGMPWRYRRNGAVVMPSGAPDNETVQRVIIPTLLLRRDEALYDFAPRVAVLAEPWTARWAREHIGEYFEVVEDDRLQPRVLMLAEEV